MRDPQARVPEMLERLERAGPALRATRWEDRVRILGRVGARFLDANDALSRDALAELPGSAGISPAQARWILEGMARDWTAPRLEALVRAEFDDPAALDRWVDDPRAPEGRRLRAFPLGPGPAVHICAGSVPGVSVTSLIRGLLVGGAVLLKPGRGDTTLPRRFLEGLRAEAAMETAARALAEAAELAQWSGGEDEENERAALAGAGSVVVYGGSRTVGDLRRRLPASTPLVEYGHRIGLAVLGPEDVPDAAAQVAGAVAAFDQRGCVSPQQVFVVGSADRATRLGEAVADALEVLSHRVPAGPVDGEQASAVQQLRGTAELREAAGEGVRSWRGEGVGWTVVLDPVPELRPSCLARTVHLTPIRSVEELDGILASAGPFLQTVGIAGFDSREAEGVAERVGRIGACRIVPLDRVAFPPAWWIHDGQGPLRRLVRWCARGPA